MNQFDAAKHFYKLANNAILKGVKNEWAIDPYSWSECISLTPIEISMWSAIRDANLVMYPQYPIDRFFADFANPVAKVVIECDGKQFHTDKEKDSERDKKMNALGWHVYRISGADCHSEYDEETGVEGYALRFAKHIGSTHGIIRKRNAGMQSAGSLLGGLIDHLIFMNPVNQG
jgi:hypothetical protein